MNDDRNQARPPHSGADKLMADLAGDTSLLTVEQRMERLEQLNHRLAAAWAADAADADLAQVAARLLWHIQAGAWTTIAAQQLAQEAQEALTKWEARQ